MDRRWKMDRDENGPDLTVRPPTPLTEIPAIESPEECEENERVATIYEPKHPPIPQPVLAPLTSNAIFLVACIKPDDASYTAVRGVIADLPGIYRSVDFRHSAAGLSCVCAFGSDAWDKLLGNSRPAELHPFR